MKMGIDTKGNFKTSSNMDVELIRLRMVDFILVDLKKTNVMGKELISMGAELNTRAIL